MATKLLRSAYQDILNLLNELYKKWNLVLDKTGTGYADAYSRYKENLPFYIPVTSDAPAIIEFVDITALNWIGSGTGKVLLVPLVRGINKGITYLATTPPNNTIVTPAVDMSPAMFKGSIQHFLDATLIKLSESLDTLIRHTDDRITIPLSVADDMWDDVALSALSYPPSDWASWDAAEIGNELERRLWARWAKNVAHSGKIDSLGNYNFAKVVNRLAALTGARDERLSKMSYSEKTTDPKANIEIMVQVLKWATTYSPIKILRYPAPARVQQEMATLGLLVDMDELIMGVKFGLRPKLWGFIR